MLTISKLAHLSSRKTTTVDRTPRVSIMKIIQLLAIFFTLSSAVQAIDNAEGGLRGLKSTKGE